MPEAHSTFAICDNLNVADNLKEFLQDLASRDAPLAAALAPHVASLLASEALDAALIWNALYAGVPDVVTAPSTPDVVETEIAE